MTRRRRTPVQSFISLIAALCLAGAVAPASAAAVERYVSPSGSDSAACTSAAPCASFARAYSVASAGDVVEIRAGSYGGQNIDVTPKASGPDVVFRPAAGASVTVGSIDITRGSYMEFRDFTVNASTYNRQQAQHITYRRIKMRQFFIRGSDHIQYLDGEVDGPDSAAQEGMNWITEPYQSSDPATDILFDGMDIHDFRKFTNGAHIDCIGIGNVNGVTIRNSRIWQCAHFAIIFGTDPSGQYTRNLLIENNFIDCCDPSGGGYYSIGLGDGDGVTIRHNSATLGFGWLNPNGDGVTNDVIDSNIISNNSSANCSKATWRYNVVASGAACSQGWSPRPGSGGAQRPAPAARQRRDRLRQPQRRREQRPGRRRPHRQPA